MYGHARRNKRKSELSDVKKMRDATWWMSYVSEWMKFCWDVHVMYPDQAFNYYTNLLYRKVKNVILVTFFGLLHFFPFRSPKTGIFSLFSCILCYFYFLFWFRFFFVILLCQRFPSYLVQFGCMCKSIVPYGWRFTYYYILRLLHLPKKYNKNYKQKQRKNE